MLERRITYRFAIISSRIGSALAPLHISRYGLSVAAWRVLAVIAGNGPLSAMDLARRTSTNAFKITRALAALSEKKLISREVDPVDRRRASLRVTRRGRVIHDEIATALEALERVVLEGLTAKERVLLFELLDKLDAQIDDIPDA